MDCTQFTVLVMEAVTDLVVGLCSSSPVGISFYPSHVSFIVECEFTLLGRRVSGSRFLCLGFREGAPLLFFNMCLSTERSSFPVAQVLQSQYRREGESQALDSEQERCLGTRHEGC